MKVGLSLYKNITTGQSGSEAEANFALISAQADNPTPESGDFSAGGPGNIRYSLSFLGFQYNLRSGKLSFDPSKNFSFGAQLLVGAEVSINPEKAQQIEKANEVCRQEGGS